MGDVRYIHVRNWGRFQHSDATRAKTERGGGLPWIRDHTSKLRDEEWLELSFADRGVLESIQLQYGSTRGRGLVDSTSSLSRLLGQRVLRSQLERLNHAGFIEFHASKWLAPRLEPALVETETETVLRTVLDTEADSPPLKKSGQEQNHQPSGHVAERLLTEIRDANNRTRDVIHELAHRLPDAAFATALESLQQRRQRTDRNPLVSEARYVVAALTTMEREGQYSR